MKTNLFLTFVLGLLVLSSCTIQKRTLNKGYFIQWNKTFRKQEKGFQCTVPPENLTQTNDAKSVEGNETASVLPENGILETIREVEKKNVREAKNEERNLLIAQDSCVELILKDTEGILSVKIVEEKERWIKYSFCDDERQKIRGIHKYRVIMIIYPDGSRKLVSALNKEESKAKKKMETKSQVSIALVVLSGIFSFFTLGGLVFYITSASYVPLALGLLAFVLADLAIITAIIGLVKAGEVPEKISHKAEKNSAAGLFLGILAFCMAGGLSYMAIMNFF